MTEIARLAAILRGEACDISDALVDAAEAEGLAPLVAASAAAAMATASVSARLRRIATDGEALSMARARELRRVLESLGAAGLRPVVIKGAHLGHTLYASPALRPRTDTDLSLEQHDHDRAAGVLRDLGYRRLVHVRGSVILGQCHFEHVDGAGVGHAIDLHWRLAAPLILRDVRSPSALLRDAMPIASLGSAARGPSLPDALIIACVHLMAHHRDAPRLLWLHDITMLARALGANDVDRFVRTATLDGVRTLCGVALRRAQAFERDAAIDELICRLDGLPVCAEPSARILQTRRKVDELWLDVRAARGWRERWLFLKEHAWPDADYMRATHGAGGSLAAAYARRLFFGAGRWMRPTSAIDRTAAPAAPPEGSAAASGLRTASRTTR